MRLRQIENQVTAQKGYGVLRTFLIEHSWTTQRELRALREQLTLLTVKDIADLYVCEVCGMLRMENGVLLHLGEALIEDLLCIAGLD